MDPRAWSPVEPFSCFRVSCFLRKYCDLFTRGFLRGLLFQQCRRCSGNHALRLQHIQVLLRRPRRQRKERWERREGGVAVRCPLTCSRRAGHRSAARPVENRPGGTSNCRPPLPPFLSPPGPQGATAGCLPASPACVAAGGRPAGSLEGFARHTMLVAVNFALAYKHPLYRTFTTSSTPRVFHAVWPP